MVTIDLTGRSPVTDAIVVATGRSVRHVSALAENLASRRQDALLYKRLKDWGYGKVRLEGLPQGDWVLVDAGDVVVHIFRAEVRSYYDLEGMWSVDEVSHRRRAAELADSLA